MRLAIELNNQIIANFCLLNPKREKIKRDPENKEIIVGKSIIELVDELPQDNITIKVLNAIDKVVPGEWENLVGFNNTISAITGETDPDTVGNIRDRALELYEDKKNGYQTAVWLYQTAEKTDAAIAAAAIADKVGDTFSFIPFLKQLTPKADTLQSIDLKFKLAAEAIAYCKLNGITLNPGAFAASVKENYQKEALLRMGTLVCIEGIIPLGADFLKKIPTEVTEGEHNVLANNPAFNAVTNAIPGASEGFITETFAAMNGWMDNLTSSVGLTRATILKRLGPFIEIADDKLDYVAAFLDASTNYFEHTGIQTVARKVIERAYAEVQ